MIGKKTLEDYIREFGHVVASDADGNETDASQWLYDIHCLTHEGAIERVNSISIREPLSGHAKSLLQRIDDERTADAIDLRRQVVEWCLRADKSSFEVAFDGDEEKTGPAAAWDAAREWVGRLDEYATLNEAILAANRRMSHVQADRKKYERFKQLQSEGMTKTQIASTLGYKGGASAVSKLERRYERRRKKGD